MKLRFTPRALSDLKLVLTELSVRSPQAERRIRNRIEHALRLIEDHPLLGAATRSRRLRRLVLSPYPYLLFYEPRSTEIVIIGIRHAARDPTSMPD